MSRFLSAFFISAAMISPLWAHHAFTAEYDARKPIDFSGAVTKVEWMNPHVYFYVQAKGPNGKTTTFAVEGASPNVLRRLRWGKDSIRVGDVITVSGFSAKNGSNAVNARKILLPDGTSLFAGSFYDLEGSERSK
jgi:hypothetical protein